MKVEVTDWKNLMWYDGPITSVRGLRDGPDDPEPFAEFETFPSKVEPGIDDTVPTRVRVRLSREDLTKALGILGGKHDCTCTPPCEGPLKWTEDNEDE